MMILKFMDIAIKEAINAAKHGEIPVGCVITKNGKVIASSHNTVVRENNSTCHAELNAINEAIKAVESKELNECDMYVTLEPCPMCAGAIINSKIKRLYIGAMEPKSGCFGSKADFNKLGFNHKPEVYYGIREEQCKKLMTDFFEKIRIRQT